MFYLQYGKVNIEQSKISQSTKSSLDDDDEGYSEESPPPDKINLLKDSNSRPVNGIKPKNGYPAQNGNCLISRDDKLMLVPEPPTNKIENDSASVDKELEEEHRTDQDAKVSRRRGLTIFISIACRLNFKTGTGKLFVLILRPVITNIL